MPKCDFNKWCSPVNYLHIFRIPFPKNTPGRLLLVVVVVVVVVTVVLVGGG